MTDPRGTDPDPAFQRVLLVGFMGSGKTEVGRALAERLSWTFRDFDEEVSSRVGLPIMEIFRQRGEPFFRATEETVGKELLLEQQVVLGSGGGWPAVEGRMENLPEGTLTVWLKVTAGEAVRRALQEGDTRPLLAVSDPQNVAENLLAQRERFYRLSHLALETEGEEPDRLAGQIEEHIKAMGRRTDRPSPPHK